MLQGKYKVYNLCSERLYDASLFEGKVWVAYHFHIYSTPKARYSQPPRKKNTKNSVAHLLMYKVFPSLTILLLCLDVNRLALQHDEFVGVLYW